MTSASVGSLSAGQSYTVRLVALDAQGASTTSDPITVAVSSTTTAIQPGVQAQALAAGQVSNVTPTSVEVPAAASAPAVGSFITSTQANGGQGFLRRVLSVSTTGGVTTLQTAPAALNEVFSALEISSNVTMDAVPAPVAAAKLDKGLARVLARANDGSPTQQRYDWPASGLSYSAAVGNSNNSKMATRAQALAVHEQGATPTTGSSSVEETVTAPFAGSTGFTVTNTVKTTLAPNIEFKAKVGAVIPTYARFAVHAAPQLVQTLADLPQLKLSLPPSGVGTGQNIAVTATATNMPNSFKATFASLPDSFITWQAWTAPRLIPPLGVTTGYDGTGSNGNYVVNVTEPGNYTLRVHGGAFVWQDGLAFTDRH